MKRKEGGQEEEGEENNKKIKMKRAEGGQEDNGRRKNTKKNIIIKKRKGKILQIYCFACISYRLIPVKLVIYKANL